MRRPTRALSPPVILFSLLFLIALAPSFHSTEVSAGPWIVQTELNESEARALLGMLSFQPDSSIENLWLVSSSQLLLSDEGGNLQPNVTLFSTCTSFANCASTSDLYRSADGSIAHVGRLQPKSSMFVPPRTSGTAEPSSFANESNTPLASINPSFSMPLEWLWAAALLVVMLVTLTFLLRNRD